MREKIIEQKLVSTIKGMGGIALKLVCPGFGGMPDRIVLLPSGRMGFVEVKAPSKVPRPLQEAKHRMLRKLGFKVYVLDRPEQITEILEGVQHVLENSRKTTEPKSGLSKDFTALNFEFSEYTDSTGRKLP